LESSFIWTDDIRNFAKVHPHVEDPYTCKKEEQKGLHERQQIDGYPKRNGETPTSKKGRGDRDPLEKIEAQEGQKQVQSHPLVGIGQQIKEKGQDKPPDP
jgi:hypothetical protein